MSAAKQTPGPWSLFIDRKSKTISIDIGAEPTGRRPCVIGWSGFDSCDLPFGSRVANARLIAAAPDLLEALQAEQEWRARDEVGAIDPEWDYERMVGDKRRAAIAKATGVAV